MACDVYLPEPGLPHLVDFPVISCKLHDLIFLYGWIKFHQVYQPHFPYTFISGKIVCLFPTIVNWTQPLSQWTQLVKYLEGDVDSFGQMSRSGMAGTGGKFVLRFLRILLTYFYILVIVNKVVMSIAEQLFMEQNAEFSRHVPTNNIGQSCSWLVFIFLWEFSIVISRVSAHLCFLCQQWMRIPFSTTLPALDFTCFVDLSPSSLIEMKSQRCSTSHFPVC